MTPKAQAAKAKINNCNYTKLINKMRRQPVKWEKTFANYVSDKGLISKIHKELIQLNSEKK